MFTNLILFNLQTVGIGTGNKPNPGALDDQIIERQKFQMKTTFIETK